MVPGWAIWVRPATPGRSPFSATVLIPSARGRTADENAWARGALCRASPEHDVTRCPRQESNLRHTV